MTTEPPRHVTTRPATAEDVATVAELWYAGWVDGHTGNVPDQLLAHRTQESFLPRTRERVDDMWVAESDGRVLGFVVVLAPEVEQVYVDATARGTGVADLLLRLAQEVVRDAGHDRAWLAVAAGNERARRFYDRQGWRDSGSYAYAAEVPGGTMPVPTRRYEFDLARPARQG